DDEGLAASVLADSRKAAGMDPELSLVQRILTQRFGCPDRALGIIGVGVLERVRAKPDEDGPVIEAEDCNDLDGLVNRLTQQAAAPRDAVRAGAFVKFLLDTYDAGTLLAFARTLKSGVSVDTACRAATGKPAVMLQLQWGESLSREQ